MEVVAFWIGLSIAVGILAGRYGRYSGGWFLLAIVISPIIAGIILLATGPKVVAVKAPPMKKCPRCAEQVQKDALICRYCGHDFAPKASVISEWSWGGARIEELDDGSFVYRRGTFSRRFVDQSVLDDFLDAGGDLGGPR
ncbi:MAG: hypothetical protein J0H08_05320 [Rhizobiales bacterium]|nr:hypothetical protein [Hyphomicrobiales bacterium]